MAGVNQQAGQIERVPSFKNHPVQIVSEFKHTLAKIDKIRTQIINKEF